MSASSNTKKFIEKATTVHKGNYEYSKVVYVKAIEKVTITCPIHGDFEQRPSSHLQGCGCYSCGINTIKKSREATTEEFIFKANKVHNCTYDYCNTKYKTSNNKVDIICPEHGLFSQEANAHLQGYGCPSCGKLISEVWSYSKWKEAAKKSKNFDSFKVYIIKCWNENEEFYKIGKTFTTIENRLNHIIKLGYNWKLIKIKEGTSLNISKLEKQLHKKLKKYSYKPKIKFGGHTECFKINNINLLTT